ncbi:hypothetical protein [Herbiconiux sp.]|uniref:hypothetical protein n=1 Tax=Herbiconiux sp. TaxID=1871186 RepID=UPI0025C377BB|nr:hypothetical protein [Herbiconiux sp.]
MVDLTDVAGWIKRIVYRLDRIEGGWLLENASITRGRVRFIGGLLQGMAGAVFEWIGTFNLTGAFTAIGSSIFRGPVSITGETGTLDVEADASFGGDVAITKTLDVTAETTLRELVSLLSDMRVVGGGKIDLGGITLEPSVVGGGAINFNPTGSIFAGLGSLGMISPDLTVMITLADGRATVAGDLRSAEGLQAMNLPNPPSDTSMFVALVDEDGNFYRGPAA